MNKFIIACAGAGKTTFIINEALNAKDTKVLITTFTDENTESIKKKVGQKIGNSSSHIFIQPWFSFLIEHGVKPFQGKLFQEEVTGLLLANGRSGLKYMMGKKPVYWAEKDFYKHYFTSDMRVYSDKIAKLVIRCNTENNGLVFQRIKSLYSQIFIDEIQDMAGYDLELIKLMMEFGIKIIMVGDPRQSTYQTHFESKYSKYNGGNIIEFFERHCEKICTVDKSSLQKTYRCNKNIIEIANLLFPFSQSAGTNMHKRAIINGVYLLNEENAHVLASKLDIVSLRYNKNSSTMGKAINIGKSKGLEYPHVFIFGTKDMLDWVFNHNKDLKEKTRSLLYVAFTRAFFSCGIVVEDSKKLKDLTSEILIIDDISITIYRL